MVFAQLKTQGVAAQVFACRQADFTLKWRTYAQMNEFAHVMS
jgi:hypothetical protein